MYNLAWSVPWPLSLNEAFMLLGFFVRAAFVRYLAAGGVWGSRLRSYCHGLAVQFQTLFPEGTFHEGDHRRIIAHLAAIPLVLKSELRNSRDIREVKGLLSYKDLGRLQCADSMVTHCVDVLRSYLYSVTNYSNRLHKPFYYGRRVSMVKFLLHHMEKMIRESMFLRTFEIAPGFQTLLNTFLGLWFLILPFALAEHSGKSRRRTVHLVNSRYLMMIMLTIHEYSTCTLNRMVYDIMGSGYCIRGTRVSRFSSEARKKRTNEI